MPKIIKSCNVFIGEPAKVEENLEDESFEYEYDQEERQVNEIIEELNSLTEEEGAKFASKKAEDIIKKAREQSGKIIEEAMMKVEEEREIVLEQARKNGFDEGYNEAVKQCEDLISEAGIIKQQAFEEYKHLMCSSEEEILSIVFDIAKKVIGHEVNADKGDILFIIKEAVETCTHKEHILLKVCEDDYEIIIKSKNKLLAMVKGVGEVEIKIDHSLEKGSCLLETPFGAVDGSVKTKIEQIEKVFRSLIEK